MGETANLRLPLVQPSQAQKHVTVNEALVRLDALAKGVLVSRTVTTPPDRPAEGAVWGVPGGAKDDWTGHVGELAIATGGGWSFVAPRAGWRTWVLDEGAALRHDGSGWIGEGAAPSTPPTTSQPAPAPSGAGPLRATPASGASGGATVIEVIEGVHTIKAGVMSDTGATGPIVPRRCVVIGVTARVVQEITGTLTSWRLGNPGDSERFGKDLGTQVGSFAEGILAKPTAYYPEEALRLTATNGSFAGGKVKLAIHLMRLTLPSA